MLKIAFDVQLLMKGEKTGIGWCTENLLKNMAQYDGFVYQLNCFTLGYNSEQLQNVEKYMSLGFKIKKCTWFHDVFYRMMWSFFPVPYSLFFGKNTDITMFFNYLIPPGVRGKKIAIIYDMTYKTYPETVRNRTRHLLNLALEKSCQRADHIITISEFSKKEIMKYLGIPKDKITVMPCGVDFSIYHPNYSVDEVNKVVEKYNIDSPYILYLGTLEPRKNIERLIQAYGKLSEEKKNLPKLVLAGRKGWMYESIFKTVKTLNLEEKIIFTGYVDEKDAPILMKGAEIFLFPSIYEGFGMPPLEAMACGTPVLVSNVSSLPEVVGDAGIQVNPFSIESIKNGMEYLINNKEKRLELSLRGIQKSKAFTWDVSAQILRKVFNGLK